MVRNAAGRLEHPFLLLGEQHEEAFQDKGSQLNHCPCPKCGISLLPLFLQAGQVLTNPGHQLLPAAHTGQGGLQLLPHLLGLAQPPSEALQLASSASHHLQ